MVHHPGETAGLRVTDQYQQQVFHWGQGYLVSPGPCTTRSSPYSPGRAKQCGSNPLRTPTLHSNPFRAARCSADELNGAHGHA